MVFQQRKSPGKNTKLTFAKCPDYASSFLEKGAFVLIQNLEKKKIVWKISCGSFLTIIKQ